MCRVFGVHRSGFYAWLKEPCCRRQQDDERVLGLIKQA
jgi:putative transposase